MNPEHHIKGADRLPSQPVFPATTASLLSLIAIIVLTFVLSIMVFLAY